MINLKRHELPSINLSYIERVEQRYDGDFDTLPDHPVVTWADEQLRYTLAKAIEHILQLEENVRVLQDACNNLQDQICDLPSSREEQDEAHPLRPL